MLTPFLFTFSEMLNQALRLDPDSAGRVKALSGNCLRLKIKGFPRAIYIRSDGEKLRLSLFHDGDVQASLSGTPPQLLRAAYAEGIPEDVVMEGATDVAGGFQNLFKRLDIDWEEILSKVLGDAMAHQIGNFVRDAQFQARRVGNTAGEHIKEWVKEWWAVTPYRFEVDDFIGEVAGVRGDTERLQLRIERLQNKLQEIGG